MTTLDRQNKSIGVSVSMITYGHAAFIEEAILSVLDQQCDFELELIIADDNSPDDTSSVVQRIIQTHPKGSIIRYFRHASNLGVAKNFVFTLEESRGDYIAFCEGDDLWGDNEKLQKQVDFFLKNPSFIASTHDSDMISEEGKYLDKETFVRANRTAQELLSGAFLPLRSLMIKNSSAFDYHLINNAELPDLSLATMCGLLGEAAYLENISPSKYRIHSGGVWGMKHDVLKAIKLIRNLPVIDLILMKNHPKARANWNNKTLNNLSIILNYEKENNGRRKALRWLNQNYTYYKTFVSRKDFINLVKHCLK